MSTDGSSFDKKAFDAALALGSTNERKIADDRQECVEPVARSPKRKNPGQEVTNARHNNTHHSEGSTNRRSKFFKSKPIKYVTDTSDPGPSFVSSRDSAKQDNASKVSVTKIETRDVRTQTDINKYLARALAQFQAKLKSLEKLIETKSQLVETIDHDFSGSDNGDDDESSEMTTDYSDASESDMDTTFSNRNVNADNLVPIGNGNALIPSSIFRNVNWSSYTNATRKLLMAVFPRRVLATHSLTGKPSPAFPNKPAKKKLDPVLVSDIVQTVAERCCVADNLVRTIITIKCADESKMFRTRKINKNKNKRKVNENNPPESDSD